MKPYGKKRQDEPCCPGHSRYPCHKNQYSILRTERKRRQDKHRKARERQKKFDYDE